MVTHDFGEALFLAQQIAVINQGRLQQTGNADHIFRHPATPFVARFVGMHNIFSAEFQGLESRLGLHTLRLASPPASTAGHVAFRPEDVKLNTGDKTNQQQNSVPGVVTSVMHQGIFSHVHIQSKDLQLRALAPTSQIVQMNLSPGKPVQCVIAPRSLHVMF
jgi:molybdate/tungstate transport system ATP-binding protein